MSTKTKPDARLTEAVPEAEARDWGEELTALLDRAATLAVAHAADRDRFMSAAHDALLRADPELQAQMERESMLAQMEVYRRMGVLAQA